MLSGKSYLIFGLTRLTVRVANALAADRASVTVVQDGEDRAKLAPLLAPDIEVRLATSLASDLQLGAKTDCVLALADNDLDNLRVAAEMRRSTPSRPVVVRAFDPALADQLEHGLGIRRAYSVSALSAPAFVMAALGHVMVESLRLGEGEVLIVEMTISPGSACCGVATSAMKERFGCAVLAHGLPDSHLTVVKADDTTITLAPGDRIALGGLLTDVLKVGLENSPLAAGKALSRGRKRAKYVRKRTVNSLPQTAAVLLSLIVVSVFVFARYLHLRFVDAAYFVVTTATTTGYGDISLRDSPDWLKFVGALVMLSGGALLGIVFSQLAAATTVNRIDDLMGRKARRLNGHVVVAGLGNLGFRVVRLLTELRIPAAVLERNPAGEFVESVRERAPVVIGDARLTDDLSRVGLDGASAVIACTDDDLSNIQMCLHARRLSPCAITVGRVFDDALASQLSGALSIDRALSASATAASAFVGAATDDRAFRPVTIGELPYLAFRYTSSGDIASQTVEGWRKEGIRVIGMRLIDGDVLPPPVIMPTLAEGDEVILCGPRDAVLRLVGTG